MAHADFIHLRNHTAYSLAEGALKIDALIDNCKRQRMPALAITDTNNMFGAIEFSDYATKAGIQPIFGVQLALAQFDKLGKQIGVQEYDPIVVLAQNETGYLRLLALQALSYDRVRDNQSPHVTLDELLAQNEGLICLTGGAEGTLARLLRQNQAERAQEFITKLQTAFAGRLYIEIQRHDLPAENAVEGALIDLAYARDIPLVATNQCFYPNPEMFQAHDALLCIAQGKAIGDPDRRRVTPQHYFKSAAEMRLLFADLPEACDNTLVIARRCSFILKGRNPLLPHYDDGTGAAEADILRRLAREGLDKRLGGSVPTSYAERLEFELNTIIQMGFAGYFLIVADFIGWAKAQNIPVGPGRGSGAGSVVAWALLITDLDPLRWGLLFERFLNPERVSMPDFDIDFCQSRRDEVIDYVAQKYGHDKVAQIITFGKLQARAVVRDVGRVLGMAYGQVDKICKLIPNNPAAPVTLQQAIDGEAALQQMRREDENVARLMDIALQLEGLYRHASTHAAGVVIGDRPLQELVPMFRDPRSNLAVTQFSMKYVEKAGLVKFDFLGLKTLTVIVKTLEYLARDGVVVDINAIPLDDAKTYAMLGQGDATGVFQLESSGMREVLKKLKPDRFEDIIAVVALYRPGPMDNIPKYISTKQGAEQPDFLHPTLEPVLRETYGIIIYQEQVMQIAQILAGYSLGGADLLRRAMCKKIQSEMDAQRAIFVEGAVKNGVAPDQASHIFDLVDKFAGYGFNKSHAAAYALISYQTAYLKANYPAHFMAAQMTLDMGDTDKLAEFRQELRRLSLPLLPPDLNASLDEFAVEGNGVRYALAGLKGVGAEAMRALVAERQQNGAFADLPDLLARLDARAINKRQIESLIAAGALDGLHANRAELSHNIELILRTAQANRADAQSQQNNLFGGAAAGGFRLEKAAPWTGMEKLNAERAAFGYYFSAHPLDVYAPLLRRLHVTAAVDIAAKTAERKAGKLSLAGVMLSKKERRSQKGNKYAFVEFTDASGSYEVTFFSEILQSARELLDSNQPVLLTVEFTSEEESYRLTAQSLRPLEDVAREHRGNVNLILDDPRAVAGLKPLLKPGPVGKHALKLFVHLPEYEVEVDLPGYPVPTGAVLADLRSLEGVRVEEV